MQFISGKIMINIVISRALNHSGFRLVVLLLIGIYVQESGGDCVGSRRPPNIRDRSKLPEKISSLKDAFYEDYSFVVRIRTSYNHTSSITCNAILMESQLVLSDVTCIKYQGMANIDAKFVQVISGESNNESVHEVDQIYINKADPRDPGTELALLRLSRPLLIDAECKALTRPTRNYSMENDEKVRVVGFSQNNELKEGRSRVTKKGQSKYICTTPGELNGTPGCQLLKGAPLLQMTDCNQFTLVGILSRLDLVPDVVPTGTKKHQDCYVMVSTQMKWFDQVKSLTSLAAKKDSQSPSSEPNVIVVSNEEEMTATS